MKAYYYVELNNGEKFDLNNYQDTVKDIWKEEGNRIKDITSIEIYVKPEEKMCYYVVNADNKGQFEI